MSSQLLTFTADELIDVDYDENATKVTRLANYLRIGLSTSDVTVMVMAAKALGMWFSMLTKHTDCAQVASQDQVVL